MRLIFCRLCLVVGKWADCEWLPSPRGSRGRHHYHGGDIAHPQRVVHALRCREGDKPEIGPGKGRDEII